MNFLGTIAVHPVLPKPIARLRELAQNLWWSWCPEAVDLFASMGEKLWDEVNHNPVNLIALVGQEHLNRLSNDANFLKKYKAVLKKFDAYMTPSETWFSKTYPQLADRKFAYFSAEFGLHESLPIYSGGLGILSGDHCKSASDLGIPLVGVGLLYNQGYFQQLINGEGVQEAVYKRLDFSRLPISKAEGPNGEPVIVAVDLPDRVIHAMVWKIQVGRVPVYLLDSDIDWNSTDDRRLSSQLYGGDRDMRICQEIILGMGGVAALRALGIEASVFHMNEGHSAFLSLARIRDHVRHSNVGFQTALEAVAGSTVFTTHTPVPAGHDAFNFDMMERYFSRYMAAVGIPRPRFLSLGVGEGQGSNFSMSVLALKTSRHCNGVSRLHGEVSRELWRDMWAGFADQEMPISYITNGVHVPTWMAPDLAAAMTKAGGSAWVEHQPETKHWEKAARAVPDEALWQVHEDRKQGMVEHVRDRMRERLRRLGRSNAAIREAGTVLDPHALTIGFARRFATYKRALLFFSDLDRVYRMVSNPARPVQILFAGKAHPADEPGKELIRRIHEISQDPRFAKHIVMVEGYDISLARNLVRGVDVWLNNPRRPLEACGTSGQKAGLNGVINFSVLDGWWDEGYNGENGWTIGEPREYSDHNEQDRADVLSLYDTLENEIIPLFFNRDDKGVPTGWVEKMRDSIVSVGSQFNTDRMLADYTRQLYVPACEQGERLGSEDFRVARSLAEWKDRVRTLWHQVHLEARSPQVAEVSVGEQVEFEAMVHLGNLAPDDVALQLFVAPVLPMGKLGTAEVVSMTATTPPENGSLRYQASFRPALNGNYAFGIRAVPNHPALTNHQEMGLVRWAQ